MKLPRALSGHLHVACEGGYAETFLNLAAEQQISLWDIQPHPTALYCCVSAADYRRLRPVAKRAQVRMRIQEKHGFPFWVRRAGLRPGLIVGILLFVALLHGFSTRTWVIRVEGNERVPASEILAVLSPLGIREGASFQAVDIANLRLSALQELPQLTWLTVNQEGSILTVMVRERTETAPLPSNAPANLVATCDGVIVRIDTFTGQPLVKVGDAVRRGDLLISGVTESRVGPQLKCARGRVIARTTRTLTVTVPLSETVTAPAHEIVRNELWVFGLRIPLYTNTAVHDDPTVRAEQYPLIAGGVELPLRFCRTRLCYDTSSTVTRTVDEATSLAQERLAAHEAELRGFFTVETRSVNVLSATDSIILTATLTGTEEIAVSVPIR